MTFIHQSNQEGEVITRRTKHECCTTVMFRWFQYVWCVTGDNLHGDTIHFCNSALWNVWYSRLIENVLECFVHFISDQVWGNELYLIRSSSVLQDYIKFCTSVQTIKPASTMNLAFYFNRASNANTLEVRYILKYLGLKCTDIFIVGLCWLSVNRAVFIALYILFVTVMISLLYLGMHVCVMILLSFVLLRSVIFESCATVAMRCNLHADSVCDACVHCCILNFPWTFCNFRTLYA